MNYRTTESIPGFDQKTPSKTAIVVGAGFGGLSTACYLAKSGFKVTLLEKNSWVGGRAQVWESQGFRFDMGPSFYWMPEVFDQFFEDFGKKRSDYYSITRLNPSYNCVFEDGSIVDIPADYEGICKVFESIEPGSTTKLESFIERCRQKYDISLKDFVYKQFDSVADFISPKLISSIPSLDLITSYSKLVRSTFSNSKLRAILEFPTVFLGAPGNRIPGTYTMMNYVDLILGTWYPEGGFSNVANAMAALARELGVTICTDSEVTQLVFESGRIKAVQTKQNDTIEADIIVNAAPYHYFESLLPNELRQYSHKYWDSRTLAPSCLNFYLGIDRILPKLQHHTFFFDRDWDTHFDETYGRNPRWNSDPLFYVHLPSKTDPSTAKEGMDAMYILIPVAAGLEDTPDKRLELRKQVLDRISKVVGFDVSNHIVTERSYAHNDFITDYHALKGSGFGLGHTLFQTASFRPKNKSRKVANLYFAGQDTIPGTSTVMSIISGKVTGAKIIKDQQKLT